MNPQDQPNQSSSSQSPQQRQAAEAKQRDATADLIRAQIGRLFGDPTAPLPPRPGAANRPMTVPDRIVTPTQPQTAPAAQGKPPMAEQAATATQYSADASTPPTPARAVAATPALGSAQGQVGADSPTGPESSDRPANSMGADNNTSTAIDSPYRRTQQNTGAVSEAQWRQYHSSWQEYYQKYYERYYTQSLAREHQKQLQQPAQSAASAAPVDTAPAVFGSASDIVSKRQAVNELRSQIRNRVSTSAVKVRKSRHFIPIIAASCVFILFMFLQYNRVLFAAVEAYVAPGSANPADIIVNPMSTDAISDEPKLIIPKLNISVPTIYENTMGSTNKQTHDRQMKAMEEGVAWFGIPGADSKPGQNGNTVLSGHSSNDVIDPGDYKFIFARLDKLTKGDTIYLNYQGTRYTYTVTGTKVVKPNQLDALQTGDDKPTLTLITCTPLGTALNRLLVYADQISPDPGKAVAAESFDESAAPAEMPGNSPTLLQRVFGGGN